MTVPTTGAGQASRAYLRETVLRAAETLLDQRPWSEITMTDIAEAADVSRQTLYNEFGNRRSFVTAYLVWTANQFLGEVEQLISEHRGDLHTALRAAFEVILIHAGSNAFLRALEGTAGAEGVLALAAPQSGRMVVALTTERLDAILREARPDLDPSALSELSAVVVRLMVSHILMATDTPQAAARGATKVLGPFLDQLEAGRQPANTANRQDRKNASTSTKPA